MVITQTRPGGGNDTMCVHTAMNPYGGGVLGIAPLDCTDDQARNICSRITAPATGPGGVAGDDDEPGDHALGREHVDEPEDIMNPYAGGGDPALVSASRSTRAGGRSSAMPGTTMSA